MITKEQLLSNSYMAKNKRTKGLSIQGVLTSEEQELLAKEDKPFQTIGNSKVFFFTDDYCMGLGLLPIEFVSSSTKCPTIVSARESLSDGIVDTVEKYISVFESTRKQITTIDELVEYVNSNCK